MRAIHPNTERVLAYVRAYIGEHGYAPAMSEIATGCGLSAPSMAMHHLRQLEKRGLIERRAGVARAITLVAQ